MSVLRLCGVCFELCHYVTDGQQSFLKFESTASLANGVTVQLKQIRSQLQQEQFQNDNDVIDRIGE